MISEEKLRNILTDLESYRVERTISTTNTDKFCEAICAFANDMPGDNQPGFLIIGAKDNGEIAGTEITDQLLQNLSSYADSGQITPFPSVTVEKISLQEGDLAIVEVLPSDIPPIRYKGRVYIRRGPRKAIANEHEERILVERRTHNIRNFDMRPCRGCSKDDLAMDLFQLTYRNMAVAPEIIEENHRDMLVQMASLGFWDLRGECATNAGAILFAEDPLNWFPGAYIQYVRYSGEEMDSDPVDERMFSGDLITVLRELDMFIKTVLPSFPEAISPLKEKNFSPYPVQAIRELLMNAVIHRDYESNAPIMFNVFSNKLEIQNPGGLYGAVTPDTFPQANDYRNPKIAEALKTLGYVNRFGRGIARVQSLLAANNNPEAEFVIEQPTYFSVTLKRAGS